MICPNEIFVRTFDQIKDGGITLHCGLPEGAEINVLKIGDIVADTKQALKHQALLHILPHKVYCQIHIKFDHADLTLLPIIFYRIKHMHFVF